MPLLFVDDLQKVALCVATEGDILHEQCRGVALDRREGRAHFVGQGRDPFILEAVGLFQSVGGLQRLAQPPVFDRQRNQAQPPLSRRSGRPL